MSKSELVKERMAISRKRTIINFILVIIIGIGSGIFLGSWYSYAILSNPIDYSQFSEEALRDDLNDIFKSVLNIKNPTEADKQNWVSTAKSKGFTPKNLTIAENFLLAEYNLQQASTFSAIGTGRVNTMGTNQSIYSAKYFDGNTYMFESISKGIINVANCIVMDKGSNTATSIKGKNITETSADWNGSKTIMTTIECKETNGNTPDVVVPYIISSKTILDGGSIVEEVVEGKKYYICTFALDPIKSVLNYIKQVKQTSGLSDYPSFDNIAVTMKLDENWNLVEFNTNENYRVSYMGLKPKCNGTLNINFIINEPVTLPEY